MEAKFSGNSLTVTRGSDPKIYSESDFFYKLRNLLKMQDHDVIKRLMVKDGHMVSEGVYYARSRNMNRLGAFMVWDGAYAIRPTYEPYNRDGEVVLSVERDSSEPESAPEPKPTTKTEHRRKLTGRHS